MPDTMSEPKLTSSTQRNMEAYFKSHDMKYVDPDAVFVNMNSGDELKGAEAIGNMLHFMYHVAFDAKAEIINTIVTDHQAVLEANFKGKHIGEFAGITPTQKEVNVPLCVTYDLENGLVKKARIYMLENVLMNQISG